MKLYTIGFTKTSAKHFFERLSSAGVRTVIDTRVNRGGQLSGFAKATDLVYFLENLIGVSYQVIPELAPDVGLLEKYRNKELTWDEYAELYSSLLRSRSAERSVDATLIDGGCLLCSELQPTFCHRRLAAEFLKQHRDYETLEIVHL